MARSIRTRIITITGTDLSETKHTMRLTRGSVTRYVWLDAADRDTHVAGDTVEQADRAADRAWGTR